jgi:hypothetical protein
MHVPKQPRKSIHVENNHDYCGFITSMHLLLVLLGHIFKNSAQLPVLGKSAKAPHKNLHMDERRKPTRCMPLVSAVAIQRLDLLRGAEQLLSLPKNLATAHISSQSVI